MTRGRQLAKGDVELGNEHWLSEAAEAHPVLTPGILTAAGCRDQAPPTRQALSQSCPHTLVREEWEQAWKVWAW